MTQLADRFDREGYVVLRGLLSSEEVEAYKRKMLDLSGFKEEGALDPRLARKGGWFLVNGVTRQEFFWPIIFKERLVAALREVLGPDVRYIMNHSSLAVNHGTVGWHRDSACKKFGTAPDWDESLGKYRIVRAGIYLQEHKQSGFALGVLPTSHRVMNFLNRWEVHLWTLIHKFWPLLKRPDPLFPVFTYRTDWVPLEPGDCIIFDQRLFHSGTMIKASKFMIYCSYGGDDGHTRAHVKYYNYQYEGEGDPPALVEKLKAAGLYLEPR